MEREKLVESKFVRTLVQWVSLPSLQCYFAEFTSTFFFVFAGVGTSVSIVDASTCTCVGTVALAADCSGGHVNLAVTFGLVVGGHMGMATGLFYLISQLMGSIVACFCFSMVTAGQIMVVIEFVCERVVQVTGLVWASLKPN